MNDKTHQGDHPSGDILISTLMAIPGPIGDFVTRFPGQTVSKEDSSWVAEWFKSRTEQFFASPPKDPKNIGTPDGIHGGDIATAKAVVTEPTRIVSLEPHFFRGFCSIPEPLNLRGDLIVIEGKNSQGKTSFTEALEWLFTGELERRRMATHGAPKELEECIRNQLIPEDEECWVEAILETDNSEQFKLRRLLVSDYGPTSSSKPMSTLFLDGTALSDSDENALLARLIAGVPPLLMQHSLRAFVFSSPSDRRTYFETLLNLDELTHLIERAVVGKALTEDLTSITGSASLKKWNALKKSCSQDSSATHFRKVEKASAEKVSKILPEALLTIAGIEFPELVPAGSDLPTAISNIDQKQTVERQETLPILATLRPAKKVDPALRELLASPSIKPEYGKILDASKNVRATDKAAKDISHATMVIARSFEKLKKAELIFDTDQPQTCPICEYPDKPTLSPERVAEISGWIPLQKAKDAARKVFDTARTSLADSLAQIESNRLNLIPLPLPAEEWNEAIKKAGTQLKPATAPFRKEHLKLDKKLADLMKDINDLQAICAKEAMSTSDRTSGKSLADKLHDEIPTLEAIANEYANAFAELDSAVGATTSQDPAYNTRAMWLDLATNLNILSDDLKWEFAKASARSELESIRDFLIRVRQEYLDARREDFSGSMTDVWQTLRSDKYSAFSQLTIPKPTGKGFPIEIEVKATLDNGTEQKEVDALRVFSESQVNVLGIAAFVTRSKMIGHKTIVLDDPVQSMDEEHFNTFAYGLVKHLLSQGFHIVLLTHNDRFARDLSFACHTMPGYVTMTIRHSRRNGIQIDEGSRRVAERLKLAERLLDQGKVQDAWIAIRRATERLYVLARKKHGPAKFDPHSWDGLAAEDMWNSGVSEILDSRLPGTGPRLHQILQLTISGAHDKSPTGETDARNAIKDLRSYLGPLGLGDG